MHVITLCVYLEQWSNSTSVVFTATLCVHRSHVPFLVGRLYLDFTSSTQAPFIRTAWTGNMMMTTHYLISHLGFHLLASRIIAINSMLLLLSSSPQPIRYSPRFISFHKHDFLHTPKSSPDVRCHGGCVLQTRTAVLSAIWPGLLLITIISPPSLIVLTYMIDLEWI